MSDNKYYIFLDINNSVVQIINGSLSIEQLDVFKKDYSNLFNSVAVIERDDLVGIGAGFTMLEDGSFAQPEPEVIPVQLEPEATPG